MIQDAIFCGLWDGAALWVEWTGVASRIEVRHHAKVERFDVPAGREWMCIALHSCMDGRGVRIWVDDTPALEARLGRATCEFSITSERDVEIAPGSLFSAVVDGAGCSYKLLERLFLSAGQERVIAMEALHFSPWCHIDRPGDFTICEDGFRIVNRGPSHCRWDVSDKLEGRLARLPHPGGPIMMVCRN